MSGLVKPKQYDWKDSNLAVFGSDDDRWAIGATKFLMFEMREILSIFQIIFITLIFVLLS